MLLNLHRIMWLARMSAMVWLGWRAVGRCDRTQLFVVASVTAMMIMMVLVLVVLLVTSSFMHSARVICVVSNSAHPRPRVALH